MIFGNDRQPCPRHSRLLLFYFGPSVPSVSWSIGSIEKNLDTGMETTMDGFTHLTFVRTHVFPFDRRSPCVSLGVDRVDVVARTFSFPDYGVSRSSNYSSSSTLNSVRTRETSTILLGRRRHYYKYCPQVRVYKCQRERERETHSC
jgi:hypothetical protein